eukprot:COSAG06_NODE_42172_length_384_cov_0.750877_1_plen_91_part_01
MSKCGWLADRPKSHKIAARVRVQHAMSNIHVALPHDTGPVRTRSPSALGARGGLGMYVVHALRGSQQGRNVRAFPRGHRSRVKSRARPESL